MTKIQMCELRMICSASQFCYLKNNFTENLKNISPNLIYGFTTLGIVSEDISTCHKGSHIFLATYKISEKGMK